MASNLSSYTLKTAAKPNFIVIEAQVFDDKSVGFHSVCGGCGVYGENWFFSDFFRFGWNPFYPTYGITHSIDGYGTVLSQRHTRVPSFVGATSGRDRSDRRKGIATDEKIAKI